MQNTDYQKFILPIDNNLNFQENKKVPNRELFKTTQLKLLFKKCNSKLIQYYVLFLF